MKNQQIEAFIQRWNIGYESKEQQIEFASEMRKELCNLSETKQEQGDKELYTKCDLCNGDGYTSEHDVNNRDYETGEHDCLYCPVLVQCEKCQATGYILFTHPTTNR